MKLFEDVIQSINYDQHEILKDIIELHCPGGFDADPAFGAGGFYKAGIKVPPYCFDIAPRDPRALAADCRDLPLSAGSVRSIIFDPPFFFGGGDGGKMNAQYKSFTSLEEMLAVYAAALGEFWRVLQPMGIVVFKCQDIIHGRKNYFIHVDVVQMAQQVGFVPIDLFLKLNKTAIIAHNYENQNHARKMHSYFWVFKKPGRGLNGS